MLGGQSNGLLEWADRRSRSEPSPPDGTSTAGATTWEPGASKATTPMRSVWSGREESLRRFRLRRAAAADAAQCQWI
jgi:hypothetical protein